jgi:hypothetical protein
MLIRMKITVLTKAILCFVVLSTTVAAQRQMEALDRGLIAVKTGKKKLL